MSPGQYATRPSSGQGSHQYEAPNEGLSCSLQFISSFLLLLVMPLLLVAMPLVTEESEAKRITFDPFRPKLADFNRAL